MSFIIYDLVINHNTSWISEAAKHLIKVSEDDKLYASYFWWKDFYTTARNDWAKVEMNQADIF